MKIVELKFVNKDAIEQERILHVDEADVVFIQSLYDAYCDGDDYTVFVDGEQV